MLCLQVLSIVTVLLTASTATILRVPGNYDHYIEGQSRWIWMAAGETGPPMLVDLYEDNENPEIDGSLNQYWLFTRRNPLKPDFLFYKDEQSVHKSNFKEGLPLIVIIHGWWTDGAGEINTSITRAFLETMDANVIVVDWRNASNLSYTKAVRVVPSVGEHTGNFINWLLNLTGTSGDRVHLVGHSLGAHAAGKAGRVANGTLGRITGLDPAGPLWRNNTEKLNISSGVYVETINTDGKTLGFFDPLGHANFYPNRGKNAQPGCWINTCSHSRAYELFASTVCFNKHVGKKCKDLDEAEKNACQGEEFHMGNGALPKSGEGIYGLSTEKEWPFFKEPSFRTIARSACRSGFRRSTKFREGR